MASSKKRSGNAKSTVNRSVPAAVKQSSNRAVVTEFNPDYTYVKKDLARIGILAGSFFVILVVLSFFLR